MHLGRQIQSPPNHLGFFWQLQVGMPTPHQYQGRALSFLRSGEKCPPPLVLSNPRCHDLILGIHHPPHLINTIYASFTGPPLISSTLRSVLAFGGENNLLRPISCSGPRITSNTRPHTLSTPSPQVPSVPRRYRARCTRYWYLGVKTSSCTQSRILAQAPPQTHHPICHRHPLRKFHRSPADIERIALGIGILGSKSPHLNLTFSASHHLDHLTSHVPETTPACLNHSPPLSSVTHSIFGFGVKITSPSRSRVRSVTPPQPYQPPHLSCPRDHPRKSKQPPTVIACNALNIWFGG